MANIYITEFAGVMQGGAPVATWPPLAKQVVAIGGTSVQSSAFQNATQIVRLVAEISCWIDIGSSPNASGSNVPLIPAVPEYFQVNPAHKLAVLQK